MICVLLAMKQVPPTQGTLPTIQCSAFSHAQIMVIICYILKIIWDIFDKTFLLYLQTLSTVVNQLAQTHLSPTLVPIAGN